MKTPLPNQHLQPHPVLLTRLRGFSLIELALVLFLVSLLTALALPRYSAQQQQGRSTGMQLELMACVQTLHGLQLQADPSEASPWLALADGDDDGLGDQAQGSLAASICSLSPGTTLDYQVEVSGSAASFVLEAEAAATGEVWVIDHLGRQGWRQGDG